VAPAEKTNTVPVAISSRTIVSMTRSQQSIGFFIDILLLRQTTSFFNKKDVMTDSDFMRIGKTVDSDGFILIIDVQ
jgi:hypothetical protein